MELAASQASLASARANTPQHTVLTNSKVRAYNAFPIMARGNEIITTL
jgi:hypothetical protein